MLRRLLKRRGAAETDKESVTIGRDGVFRRYRRWVMPKPVKTGHIYVAQMAREAFSVDRPVCPDCVREGRDGKLLPISDEPQSRQCNVCKIKITLNEIKAASDIVYSPAVRRDFFIRRATNFFVVTCALLIVAILFAVWQRSWAMFLFAGLFSMPLFMSVFAMRYRAWQIERNRLFEQEAPFGDFIADEMRLFFNKRA